MVEPKKELLPILEQIEREKGLKKEGILKVIESALISAYRKHAGKNARFEAMIVPETAEVKAFVIKTVVETVKDPNQEISIKEAEKIDSNAKLGTDIKIPVDTQEFSRIAAQTAKQVIIQKIRESERINLFQEFKSKEGTVVSGVVYRFINKSFIVDLGKTEAILPPREQIPNERLKVGEHIRVYVVSVEQASKGIKVLVSRNRPEMVKKLFEIEVPEIYEKVVEIVNIVRDPGVRTKIAVISHNPKVDPVGACVGIKGSRVKPIIDELKGERIDLIPYTDDCVKFISDAFSPTKVQSVNIINKEQKKAEVIVSDDMLAFAIGKHGNNINLVSKLIGWQIDVKSESQKKQELTQKVNDAIKLLTQLEGVGPKLAEILNKAGWNDIKKIAAAKVDELTTVNNVGEKTAQKIIESAKKYIQEHENGTGKA